MSDEALRSLERRWNEREDVPTGEAFVRSLVRGGQVVRARRIAAAAVGAGLAAGPLLDAVVPSSLEDFALITLPQRMHGMHEIAWAWDASCLYFSCSYTHSIHRWGLVGPERLLSAADVRLGAQAVRIPIPHPDGTRLAFVATRGPGTPALWCVLDLTTHDVWRGPEAKGPGNLRPVAWSGDVLVGTAGGSRFRTPSDDIIEGWHAGRKDLRRTPIAKGTAARVAPGTCALLDSGTVYLHKPETESVETRPFSPDFGRLHATHAGRVVGFTKRVLTLVGVDGPLLQTELNQPLRDDHDLVFAPSGRILAVPHLAQRFIRLIDLRTGEDRDVPLEGAPKSLRWSPSGDCLAFACEGRLRLLSAPG